MATIPSRPSRCFAASRRSTMLRSTTERSTQSRPRKGVFQALPLRSRCLHPGQQHGRRMPSSSSSCVRRMRRSRVFSCLASFDPADEFVACQRRDVFPRGQRGGVGQQRRAQIRRKCVDHPRPAPGHRSYRQVNSRFAASVDAMADDDQVGEFAAAPPRAAPGVTSMVGYRSAAGRVNCIVDAVVDADFIVSLDDGVQAAETAEALPAARRIRFCSAGCMSRRPTCGSVPASPACSLPCIRSPHARYSECPAAELYGGRT